MSHVDPAGRIGKHLEHVVFRIRTVIVGLENPCLFPHALPAGFRLFGIVSFNCHKGSPENLSDFVATFTMKPAKRQPLSRFGGQVRSGLADPGRCIRHASQNHGPIGKPTGLR
jgi:hypothetical protein